LYQLLKESINQSNLQRINQSINQSINRSINQSINQSISQPINRAAVPQSTSNQSININNQPIDSINQSRRSSAIRIKLHQLILFYRAIHRSISSNPSNQSSNPSIQSNPIQSNPISRSIKQSIKSIQSAEIHRAIHQINQNQIETSFNH
jgi:hypothetical protein